MLLKTEFGLMIGKKEVQGVSVWIEGKESESICLIEVDGKLVEYDKSIHNEDLVGLVCINE